MDLNETALQLYKVEYEKAAERYDNIYRSNWTIFSYLTAVTAGLLAFGSERIEPHLLICIAAIPLLFWFWTTYLPLDRYGNATLNRLCEIEELLNERFGTKLGHFTGAKHGLNELSIFENLGRSHTLLDWWHQIYRARFAICLIFILFHFLVVFEACKFRHSGKPPFLENPATPTVVIHL